MWLLTEKGELVNLNHIESIFIILANFEENKSLYKIVGYLSQNDRIVFTHNKNESEINKDFGKIVEGIKNNANLIILSSSNDPMQDLIERII